MIFFILNSKDFLTVLISNNKYLFCMLLGSIWESTTPFCMDYNYRTYNSFSNSSNFANIYS